MIQARRVLVADDDPQMQLAVKASLMRAGYDVHVVGDGKAAWEKLNEGSFDLIISDQRMPEMTGQEVLSAVVERGLSIPFIMITAYGTISEAVEAMQKGAADFITKPFSADELERVVERVMTPEHQDFRSQRSRGQKGRPIITKDPRMIRILEVAEAVAKSDATVLVQGESGTGKELIARLVHTASPRSEQMFIAVNCAALPENLLESELFGHEKGAFTGAQNRKPGKFELAHGGTILLDEISEMELGLQAKLLRVLQEREVDRVGGREPIPIDVRVIATTNRNLEDLARRGEFREDLYYRLNVIPLTLPPLRERQGDIGLLVQHFMKVYLGQKSATIEGRVLEALENHPWPGNVRELQNAVERAAILASGRDPQPSDFLLGSFDVTSSPSLAEQVEVEMTSEPDPLVVRSGTTVHEMERALIFETLRSTNNNRTRAAKMLGISVRTLRNKLSEYRVQGYELAE